MSPIRSAQWDSPPVWFFRTTNATIARGHAQPHARNSSIPEHGVVQNQMTETKTMIVLQNATATVRNPWNA